MKADSLMIAIEGCEYVVHTASPFPLVEPKDENELIKPAVDGTLAVMQACRKHKVKRVVVTSSVASIFDQNNMKEQFNEEDWPDTNTKGFPAYNKSKTLAERSAWEFIKELPEDEKFELVTINPGLILGPATVAEGFSSGVAISKFMLNQMPGIPKVSMAMVDVRDVALAHLRGLKIPEAAGNRFILNAETIWLREMAQYLYGEFTPDYKIKTKELSYCTFRMAAIFIAEAKGLIPIWDKRLNLANEKSKKILGINYIQP